MKKLKFCQYTVWFTR